MFQGSAPRGLAAERDVVVGGNLGAEHQQRNDQERDLHTTSANNFETITLNRLDSKVTERGRAKSCWLSPKMHNRHSASGLFQVAVTEHLCREGLQGCPMLPGIHRQPGFAASLLQEGNAVPSVFHWNLGQKQTPVHAL